MRVLVCGGRGFVPDTGAFDALATRIGRNDVIIHGCARGADEFANDFAVTYGIAVERYPAEWKKYGRAAGAIRNQKMLDEGRPDLVIAFPGGRGTEDMIKRALKARVRLVIVS